MRELCISLSVKHNIISRDDFHPSYSLYKSKACDWLVTRIRKEFTSKIHKKRSHVESAKTEEISHHAWAGAKFAQGNVLCEFRTVLCEFRTILEQLSFEGHIFLILAPNHTRFEALDSWLPELWNGISMEKMDFGKCSKSAKEDCSCCPLFSSFCLFFLFASLLYLACLNDPKSYQNTKTSHKYD